MLAAACRVARSRGRAVRPSALSPAAIAPEETSTISTPAPRRSASTFTSVSIRAPCPGSPPRWSARTSPPSPRFGGRRRLSFCGRSRSLHHVEVPCLHHTERHVVISHLLRVLVYE